MSNTSFQVGDIVRKKRGSKLAKVTTGGSGYIYAKYLESGAQISDYATAFVLHEEPIETQPMNTLYSFTEGDTTVYASVIGKTQTGELVLEARGGNGIYTKKPSEVTEVIPYTVSIKFGNTDQHFEATEGALCKGDVVLSSSGSMGVVTATNTKNKSAKTLKGARKVLTAPITP